MDMFKRKKKEEAVKGSDVENKDDDKDKKEVLKLPFYVELDHPFELSDGTQIRKLVCESRPTLKMVKELMAAEEYEYIDCIFDNLLEAVVDEGTIPLTPKLVNKIDAEDGINAINKVKSFFPNLAES